MTCGVATSFHKHDTALLNPLLRHETVSWELAYKLSLIDWISDTRPQGYTDLQSLVKCLDHRDIVLVLDTVYACSQAKVVLGCMMH